MSVKMTSIQWTDQTINFWQGCTKVSEGCKYCYMYRDKHHYGQDPTKCVLVSEKTIRQKLKELEELRLVRLSQGITEPLKIFTCSWSDFFIKDADQWRDKAWQIIKDHPQFIWQILTKREDRMFKCMPADWGEGWDHVWIGVSIENAKNLNRLRELAMLRAKVKFISFEPLLSRITFSPDDLRLLSKIDWAIIGGESGNDTGQWLYRPCELEWIQNLMMDCISAGVFVFVKQLGTYIAKKYNLRDRHGGNWNEWPTTNGPCYAIREFPQLKQL